MKASHHNRRCPKCGGNLFLINDYQGWYEQCLQCSFTLYLDLVYQDEAGVSDKKTSGVNQSKVSSA